MSKVRRYVVDAMDEDEDGEVVFYDCYQKLQEDYDYIKREWESACERAEYKKELLEENIKLTGQVTMLREALAELIGQTIIITQVHDNMRGENIKVWSCVAEAQQVLAKLEQDEN